VYQNTYLNPSVKYIISTEENIWTQEGESGWRLEKTA